MNKQHSFTRVLALVLTVAMLLSIGFVMPVAADDIVELGHLHEDPNAPQQAGNGEIPLVAESNIAQNYANFYAESADCVKMLKSGSDATKSIGQLTEYGTSDGIIVSRSSGTPNLVIRNSQWNINCAGGGTSPLAYGDTLIVGGNFTTGDGKTVHISTTYITKDADGNIHCSDKFEAGKLSNPTTVSDGITFDAEYNCYTATWNNFKAEDAGNVKLFRNGAVYSIGALTEYGTSDGIFVSRNGNVLYLRNSQWNLNCTGINGLSPLSAGDILYIGGSFSNGTETFHVAPIYFTKDADGNITEVDGYNVGTLSVNATNPAMTSDGFIYSNSERGYANSWQDYKAENADCVKMRKAGSDDYVSIGEIYLNGCTDGILVKRGDNVFCVKSNQWLLNCAGHSELSPMAEGDVMIVEGNFTGVSDGVTVTIEKTYITIKNGNLVFSTTEPQPEEEPSEIEAGVMKAASNTALNDGGFYFSMDDNRIPYEEGDWSNEFFATSADVIKLIRGGSSEADAVSIAQTTPGRAPFVKYDKNSYYFNGSDGWHLGSNAPLQNGDILIVEGEFTDGDVSFTVAKSVIVIGEDGNITFTDEVPAPPAPVIEAGVMSVNSGAATLNSGNFYFTMAANEVPFDGWSYEYKATSADCVKLLRGSYDEADAVSVGLTDKGGCIIKYSDTNYYFKGETGWTIDGTYAPLRAGDIIIVEGNFVREDTTFHVSKSVIVIGEDGSISIGTEIPEPPAPVIELGTMKAASDNALKTGGFYFTMDANEMPYDEGWGNEWLAENADCIKLLRGTTDEAEAVSIAQTTPGRAPFIKYNENGYYFNTDTWHIGNSAPIVAGDILIIEGNFTRGDLTAHVSKSVVICNADGTVSFATEVPVAPSVVEAGAMNAASNTNINNGGFYFTMAANAIPYVTDWSTRFYATSADCVKLTRNGVTTSVGQTAAGRSPIIKYGETAYYFDGGNPWYIGDAAPLTVGDVLCVEGEFTDGTNTFNITKTYIAFNWDGSVSFSATEPAAPEKPFADTQEMTVAVWNGSFHNFGMKQMYDLRMAGINTIIGINPYWLGSNDTERNNAMNKLLDLASLYGITVYPALKTENAMWNGTSVPGYNTQHEAIGGFLIQDEPSLSEMSRLGTLKTAFDANEAFAGKEFLVNLYPQSSSNIHIGGSYASYVDSFINNVHPETIGVDIYPLNATGNARKDYFENFAILAAKAKANGCKLQYTMLACAHSTNTTTYAVPTAAELRWQYDVAMAFGANEFVQYIYTSHDDGYNTMADTNGNITNETLYNNIATANAEHTAWADTYASYGYVGTAAVKNGTNPMIDSISSYAAALPEGAAVTATGDVLVGIFEKDGENAYMITNAGKASSKTGDFYTFSMSAATVTLTMNSDCDTVEVIKEGKVSYIAAENGSFTIAVPAYEGAFVKAHTHNFVDGTCSSCGAEEAAIKIISASLKLDEDIDVIYTVNAPAGCTDIYMVINGVEIRDYAENGGNLEFTYTGITPQKMTDNISATVYATKDDKTVSDTVAEYSVRKYCENQLAKNPETEFKTLLSDLLTYGAAAQTYTGYKADALATAGLDLTPSAFSALSGKNASFSGTKDANVDWSSATLVLSNALAVRFNFRAASVEGLTVTVSINGRTETFEAKDFVSAGDGKYYIDFCGIKAAEFDDTVTASFAVNGAAVGRTVSYSVNTYICGTQNVENANLQALVRALYNYGAAAKNYANK